MFNINKEKCIACKQCINDCPVNTISLNDSKAEINNDRCLKCGHCIAICPVEAVSTDNYNMNDVKPYDKGSFTIESENFLNFIKFRRSVRKFKRKDVEKEKILKIIESGRFTQTSTNNQDVSYIVLTEKLDEFKNLAYESLKKKGEYILENLTPETEHLKNYATLWLHIYEKFKKDPILNDSLFFNAPVAIFVVSKTQLNGGLASANMANMVEALGLGTFFSGFSTFASQDNKEIMKFLEIKDSKHLISCLVIGYPDVKYRRTTPRKDATIKWL